MSEMVELVARGIYAREKMRKESMERVANQGGEGPWVALFLPYDRQNEIYRDLARAAIEVVRERFEKLSASGSSAYGQAVDELNDALATEPAE